MFKHIKNNKGFTLVELIVVVAIVGILAAIAVPSFQNYTKTARINGAKTGLSNVYTIIKVGETENKEIAENDFGGVPKDYYQIGITPHDTAANAQKPVTADRVLTTTVSGVTAADSGVMTDCDYKGDDDWKAGAVSGKSKDENVRVNHLKNFKEVKDANACAS